MTDAYNAADLRKIRAAEKAARLALAERKIVLSGLMSSPPGRAYVLDTLTRGHIFAPSFNPDPYVTAFNEGERNICLQLLNDIMRFCPDQYIQMMREQSDKEIVNDQRNDDGRIGDQSDSGRTDNDGPGDGAVSDYDPGLDDNPGA